ncbi:hypothetical protein C0995_007643 [Termitomyces sp. Mi166|nr:hypothetical protein C0995_007643 [Termitomyces sp. Mi166\
MHVSILFITNLVSNALAALLPPLYQRFPTGSIKPSGWALDQARIQADGLAGHLRDFDSYVNGSIWVENGSIEYSEMHEAAPYWFNGQVALAFQLEDPRLLSQVRSFLDWTLLHQGTDGWIGPEAFVSNATIPRLVWPRYLVLLGLIQYAEADPSQRDRIVDAMHRFVALANEIWKTGQQGVPSMGFQFDYQYVRWEEVRRSPFLHRNRTHEVLVAGLRLRVVIRQCTASYDLTRGGYDAGKEDLLLETMHLVRNQGFSWKTSWYTDATFPKDAVTSFTQQTHGVNNAEALKSEALAWRFTGDETDKQNTFDRLNLVYGYHGRASGTFAADEHLAGLDPSRGEQIFSLATIYQTFGNNSVADRVERLAYNALPAGIMHDWLCKSHSIFPPELVAEETRSPPIRSRRNYPCCTVNHPQAYPKFWAHSFFANQAGDTLIHALLGPSTFSGTLGASNNTVEVTVDSLYPFGSTLRYTIASAKPFTFAVRIPDWAQNDQSTILVNNKKVAALTVDDESLQLVKITGEKTTIQVSLNAPLKVENRYNGAVAITRGALNYALEISYNTTTAPGLRSVQALNDVKRLYPNAPAEYLTPTDPHTEDNTLLPTSEWRVAIDPSTILVHDNSRETSKMPYYAWAPDSSPVTMTALACRIAWGLASGTASVPPVSPNQCVGPVFTTKLVPFASAKLRLGEIPTMRAT